MSYTGSELSDDYSHFDDYGSRESERSTLADLLERFTIETQPECTLKLRSTAGPVVVGADLTRITGAKSNVGALVLKPSGDGHWWRRLRVDNSGTLTLRSRKLHWWLFTLDVIGHANPFTKSFDLSYRVATKWDVTKGEIRNKKRWEVGPKAEARAHWSISYCLPAIEGSMGTAAQRMTREVHTDVGYAHLDIPRVELVWWPRGRPEEASSSGSVAAQGGYDGSHADAWASDGAEVAAAGWEPAAGSGGSGAGGPVLPDLALAGGSSQRQRQRQQRQLGSGGSSSSSKDCSSAQRRKASLQQLNSHIACISGRWWASLGSNTAAT